MVIFFRRRTSRSSPSNLPVTRCMLSIYLNQSRRLNGGERITPIHFVVVRPTGCQIELEIKYERHMMTPLRLRASSTNNSSVFLRVISELASRRMFPTDGATNGTSARGESVVVWIFEMLNYCTLRNPTVNSRHIGTQADAHELCNCVDCVV